MYLVRSDTLWHSNPGSPYRDAADIPACGHEWGRPQDKCLEGPYTMVGLYELSGSYDWGRSPFAYELLAVRRELPFVGPVVSLVPRSLTLGVPQREHAHYCYWASSNIEGRAPFGFEWQYFDRQTPKGYRPAPTLRLMHVHAIRATWETVAGPSEFYEDHPWAEVPVRSATFATKFAGEAGRTTASIETSYGSSASQIANAGFRPRLR